MEQSRDAFEFLILDVDHELALVMNQVHDLKETLTRRDRFVVFQKERLKRRIEMFDRLSKAYHETGSKLAENAREIQALREQLDDKSRTAEVLTASIVKLGDERDTLRELQSASNQVNIELIREKTDLQIANQNYSGINANQFRTIQELESVIEKNNREIESLRVAYKDLQRVNDNQFNKNLELLKTIESLEDNNVRVENIRRITETRYNIAEDAIEEIESRIKEWREG